MPTENERKYVLNIECEKHLENNCKKIDKFLLHQGYLAFSKGMTLRLRSCQQIINNNLVGEIKRKLCYKQKVNDRVIEIEKKIDKRDFDDLWTTCLNKVQTYRYSFYLDKNLWEIDFFKNHHNETYFAMAECEMSEDYIEPEFIPEFIEKNILYFVPIDSDDYSTKRLACFSHAKKIYKKLINVCSHDEL